MRSFVALAALALTAADLASAGPCKPRPTTTAATETTTAGSEATTLPDPPTDEPIVNSCQGGGMTDLTVFNLEGDVQPNGQDGFTKDGSPDTACAQLSAQSTGPDRKRQNAGNVAAIGQNLSGLNTRTKYTIQFYYRVFTSPSGSTACTLEAFIGDTQFYNTGIFANGASVSYNQVLVSTSVPASEGELNIKTTCANGGSASVLIDSIFISNQVTPENIGNYQLDFGDGQVREPVNTPATTVGTQMPTTQAGAVSTEAAQPTSAAQGGEETSQATQGSGSQPTSATQGSGSDATTVSQGSGSQPTSATQGSGSDATTVSQGSGSQPSTVSQGSGSDATTETQGSGSQPTSVSQGSGSDATTVSQGSGSDATTVSEGSGSQPTSATQDSGSDVTTAASEPTSATQGPGSDVTTASADSTETSVSQGSQSSGSASEQTEATSVAPTTTAPAGTDSTSTAPVEGSNESTTVSADAESTVSANAESTTVSVDAQSTTASVDAETTVSVDAQSTTASVDAETTVSADAESTTVSADAQSTTASVDAETTVSADAESTTVSADAQSTTASVDAESTTVSADAESTTVSADAESTTVSADAQSTTTAATITESTSAPAITESTSATSSSTPDETTTSSSSEATEVFVARAEPARTECPNAASVVANGGFEAFDQEWTFSGSAAAVADKDLGSTARTIGAGGVGFVGPDTGSFSQTISNLEVGNSYFINYAYFIASGEGLPANECTIKVTLGTVEVETFDPFQDSEAWNNYRNRIHQITPSEAESILSFELICQSQDNAFTLMMDNVDLVRCDVQQN
ncbi:translation initiation factor if-2 [Fusarium longipes]|uniref:Translation initiation factor if-2 n=1 Tax=Fusarium longipes TaxID=694270 RepID=A0A395SXB2_9HYPO|nr:translation initiation factor if-2 [Fusarium longipes]